MKQRTSLTVEDARVLLDAYDEWFGNINPDHRDEYMSRFNRLRNRLTKLEDATHETK